MSTLTRTEYLIFIFNAPITVGKKGKRREIQFTKYDNEERSVREKIHISLGGKRLRVKNQ